MQIKCAYCIVGDAIATRLALLLHIYKAQLSLCVGDASAALLELSLAQRFVGLKTVAKEDLASLALLKERFNMGKLEAVWQSKQLYENNL